MSKLYPRREIPLPNEPEKGHQIRIEGYRVNNQRCLEICYVSPKFVGASELCHATFDDREVLRASIEVLQEMLEDWAEN